MDDIGKGALEQRVLKEEKVLCFKKEGAPLPPNQPIIPYNKSLWDWILVNSHPLPRSSVEKNPNYKQLVVYVVIKYRKTYLLYRRTPKSGEERLSERCSIGIGGHVNSGDRGQLRMDGDFICQAAIREISEEVNIHEDIQHDLARAREPICFINDESDEVGKVHFGIVWLLELRKPKVTRKGTGIGKLEFLELEFLNSRIHSFEKWSQLLIEYFTKTGM